MTKKTLSIKKLKEGKWKKQDYKNLADMIFSLFVRRHWSFDGLCNCVTCVEMGRNEPISWKDAQCGHYGSRMYLKYRYDFRNVKVQCRACNCAKSGNYFFYSSYMQRLARDFDVELRKYIEDEYKSEVFSPSIGWYIDIIIQNYNMCKTMVDKFDLGPSHNKTMQLCEIVKLRGEKGLAFNKTIE